MDREDPEKRIAELERQLLERRHERAAEPMPSPSPSPGQRTFEATAQRVNWKWAAFLACGFIFAMFFLPVVLMTTHTHLDKHWFHWGFLGLYGVVVVGLGSSRAARSFFQPKVSIRPVGDVIEIMRGSRTKSFPSASARLGPWGTGSALHLRNGRHRFVIGGQSHCPPPGTQPTAKSVWAVNAYMPAADFDALLATVYRPR
jgi:hypothetical protein